jgi:alpha-methylacyl-CoA racemase
MDLDGVRVLDLTQLLPGPYGSQLLADMGAEVIKVEPPTGDPARAVQADDGWAGHVFSAVNSNKQSIAIDLKTDAGRAAFYDLVSGADVVFEQFRPGVTERLGIDYGTLTDYREDIVYCSLTGYGQEGPDSARAGHDLNYVGVAGLLDMTRGDATGDSDDGTPESERPTPLGYPVADMSGGLMAVTAILGGLLERELGGGGTHLDVSMTDAVLSYGQVELAMADDGLDPRPGETPMTGSLPWYDVYETADGRHITLAALEPRFFGAFCEAVDRPDLFEYHLTQDESERDTLGAELAELFAERTRSEWLDLLGDDAMVGPVNTPSEALSDPHLAARDTFVGTSAGHRRVRLPIREAAEANDETATAEAVPELGEHTDEILADCGFDPGDIEKLREQDAVR